MGSWTENKISIKDLQLWDQNARFPEKYFNQPEKELIEYFCSQDNFKILDFAKEVINDFDLPQIEKLIIFEKDGEYIVREGNRRVTVYKILSNLDFSPQKYRDFFENLKSKISINENTKLECLVTQNEEETYRIIDRKHLRQNNEVSWKELERSNSKVRRNKGNDNDKFLVMFSEYIKTIGLPESIIESVLGAKYFSTFKRLISKKIKDKYGIKFDGENITILDNSFNDKLKVFILDVLDKKRFNGTLFSRLNGNSHVEYFESIADMDISNISKRIENRKGLFDENSPESNKYTESEDTKSEANSSELNSNRTGRKTPLSRQNEEIFGRTLQLKSGRVNDMYLAIDKIYTQNKNDLNKVYPILAMSLRLILDVSGREYFKNDSEKSKKDQLFKDFIEDAVKPKFREVNLDENLNYIALSNDWLSKSSTHEATLQKWAHGHLISDKTNILQMSFVVGDILEMFFGKDIK